MLLRMVRTNGIGALAVLDSPAFTYALPWIEALAGLLILTGPFTSNALIAGGVMVLVLQVGVCLAQDWHMASDQLIYVAIYCALIGLVARNRWSLDDLRASAS